jgi:hypothetical protein
MQMSLTSLLPQAAYTSGGSHNCWPLTSHIESGGQSSKEFTAQRLEWRQHLTTCWKRKSQTVM